MLLLDQVDRQTLADRQVAATLRAAGHEIDLPSLAEQRDAFDAALSAEPGPAKHIDQEQLALRRALGVA